MDRNAEALTDIELHQLVDGQGDDTHMAKLRERLARDPVAQAKVAAWQAQRELLGGLHRQLLDEPIPVVLTEAVQRVHASQQSLAQWRRRSGMAAAILLSFGAGWLAHQVGTGPTAGTALSIAQADFVQQASSAYAVYSPEVRHPVEVAAADQAHLVQWLSKRIGKPLKVPDLSAQGYALVGGRLLPGSAGARAQFMFQNGSGGRITLYLGAVGDPAKVADRQETAFRFAAEGQLASFYWVDQGFGYALTGRIQRDALMALAQAVYPQL